MRNVVVMVEFVLTGIPIMDFRYILPNEVDSAAFK